MRPSVRILSVALAACLGLFALPGHAADDPSAVQEQLRKLQQENADLQRQMRLQQERIEELSRKMSGIESNRPAVVAETAPSGSTPVVVESSNDSSAVGRALGKVRISGEGQVGFFKSQANGQSPNGDFRVDEAKLFVEAPIWGEVYFFSELDLFLREEGNFNVRAGELYLDAENLSRWWDQDGQLNLRAGRLNIPFGEEYLSRDAIDNPLVSHSLMDFWGVDEGLELYGKVKTVQYVVAVQNGGLDAQHDFNGDKSVAGRIGYNPAPWLHLSVSAMRTGNIEAQTEWVSDLWLGSGFVRSLGSSNTTRFHANIVQGDIQARFPGTVLKAWGGMLRYNDNDPSASNRRDVFFYSLEATQRLWGRLYAAARWNQAFAPDGFPIVGNGAVGEYFFQTLTRQLNLLSVGLNYRWSDRLILKGEYSFEWGHEPDGTRRDHENMLGVTAAFAF